MSLAEALQKIQTNEELKDKLIETIANFENLNSKLLFLEQINMKKNCLDQNFEIKLNRIEANIIGFRKDLDLIFKELKSLKEQNRYKRNYKSWWKNLIKKN
jgi:hypothetical protein